jgi:hypothetical protein
LTIFSFVWLLKLCLFLTGISEQFSLNSNRLNGGGSELRRLVKRQAEETALPIGESSDVIQGPISSADAVDTVLEDEAAKAAKEQNDSAPPAAVIQDDSNASSDKQTTLTDDEESSGNASTEIVLPDSGSDSKESESSEDLGLITFTNAPAAKIDDENDSSGAVDTVTLSPTEEPETTTRVDEETKQPEDVLPTDGEAEKELENDDFQKDGQNKALDKNNDDGGDENDLADDNNNIEGTTADPDGPSDDDDGEEDAEANATTIATTTTTDVPFTARRVWFWPQGKNAAQSNNETEQASSIAFLNKNCPYLDCEFGFRIDQEGKPSCSCYNPCNV